MQASDVGAAIDAVLATRDRVRIVELLATLKHREVLIHERLYSAARRAEQVAGEDAWVDPAEAALLLRLNVRTLYRAARRPPLSDCAVWITPRRVRFNRTGLRKLVESGSQA